MPLTPVCQRSISFFSESSHVACQINRNEVENTMQANILPFYTPTTPRWGQNIFLLKKVMFYIKFKGKKCRTLCKFDLMHNLDIFVWVKRSDIESVLISIICLNLVN